MDFYIDIGAAVLLRLLKERKGLDRYRALFIKLAQAIIVAYSLDQDFQGRVKGMVEGIEWTKGNPAQ